MLSVLFEECFIIILQLTTAVTSAFLLAKVILSKVCVALFPVPLLSAQ